jgi:hypothetical protein
VPAFRREFSALLSEFASFQSKSVGCFDQHSHVHHCQRECAGLCAIADHVADLSRVGSTPPVRSKAKAEYSEHRSFRWRIGPAEVLVCHSLAAVPGIFSSLIVFHTDFLSATAAADRPPCLSPFIATRAFPSRLLGPVLFVHGCLRLMAIWSDRNPFGVS